MGAIMARMVLMVAMVTMDMDTVRAAMAMVMVNGNNHIVRAMPLPLEVTNLKIHNHKTRPAMSISTNSICSSTMPTMANVCDVSQAIVIS